MLGSRNNTNVPDFILMGLTDSDEIGPVLFMLFLLIYQIALFGNARMILIIHLDLQLHTPMYSFLSHLSLLDLGHSTAITPKTLENLLTYIKYISFIACFTQMYFFFFLAITEFFLLSSMLYDHCVRICKPLHYQVIMSMRLCRALITGSYVFGFTESLVIVLYMNSLHLRKSNVIYHFFCDIFPILALSCTDIYATEILIFILGNVNVMMSLITISVFCGSILSSILKINSTSGKRKVFSTCTAHILGVAIYFTSFAYLKSENSYSLGKDQVTSVFYTMVVPMLNPFIYSLRNKEVKMLSLEPYVRGRAPDNGSDCDAEHLSSFFFLSYLTIYWVSLNTVASFKLFAVLWSPSSV